MRFARLYNDAKLPTRKHNTDAGIDIYSYSDAVVGGNSLHILKTGITVEIPVGYVLQAWPKSRSDFMVGGGIIDSGYQGEILIKIVNVTQDDLVIKKGDAIAQLVLVKNLVTDLEELSLDNIHQSKSDRGNTGGIVNQV